MKKFIKGISLFIVIVFSLLLVEPLKVSALTKQTSFSNIKSLSNLEIEDLSFQNINFVDYSKVSTQAFGLTGLVKNNANNKVYYTATVYYYDINLNLLAKWSNNTTATAGMSYFNLMSNLSVLGSHILMR